MSHNCHATVAKFIAHEVFFKRHNDESSGENDMFIDSGCYIEENNLYSVLENGDEQVAEVFSSAGWKLMEYDSSDPTLTQVKGVKHLNRVFGDMWVKDNYTVWLVNESQYSDIGECSIAVLAETKESIEQFLNDHELKATIESDDVAQCWF